MREEERGTKECEDVRISNNRHINVSAVEKGRMRRRRDERGINKRKKKEINTKIQKKDGKRVVMLLLVRSLRCLCFLFLSFFLDDVILSISDTLALVHIRRSHSSQCGERLCE